MMFGKHSHVIVRVAKCHLKMSNSQSVKEMLCIMLELLKPSLKLSADPLGCEFDEKGKCIKTEICRVGVHENRRLSSACRK